MGNPMENNDNEKQEKLDKKPQGEPDKNCFTIMPFGGWFDDYYEEIYKPAIEESGLISNRADDLSRSSTIINDIWDFTKSATIVLADLTEKNPNVFYELGLAHALAKPAILVANSMDDVPFDLRALRIVIFDKNKSNWGKILKKKIVKSINEILESPLKSVLPAFLEESNSTTEPPHITRQEKVLLELKNDFDSLRRQVGDIDFSPRITISSPTISSSHTQENITVKTTKEAPKDVIENLIKSGIKKGASDASIIKRLKQYNVRPEKSIRLIKYHRFSDNEAV